MITNLISQTVIDEVIVNSEDSLPNKIKEKEESLQNTLLKRLSIPMMAVEEPKQQQVYTAEPVAEEKVVSEAAPVQQNTYVEEPKAETSTYNLMDLGLTTVAEGSEKPINVKEHMINNIRKKAQSIFLPIAKQEETTINNEEVAPVEPVMVPVEETPVFENGIENDIAETKVELGQYGIPANIEKTLSSTFDFDTTMVAINQTREQFMNVSEKANIATKAANESEELLEKLSNEYTEAEKQLKAKEQRSIEMEQKIISILNTERDRLSKQMHEKESVISDANRRKEETDGKIVNFRTKINTTMEKANEIDEKISRQEELLNSLFGYSVNLDNYQTSSEEKTVSKVA